MVDGTIRVLLAEDIEILRKGLKAMLGGYPDMEIAGEASDGLEAVSLAGALRPHVVLMDLSMPRMTGTEAISAIKKRNPEVRILALTGSSEVELVRAAISAGADGYLLKNVPADELALAIRRVFEGRPYFSPEISGLLHCAKTS